MTKKSRSRVHNVITFRSFRKNNKLNFITAHESKCRIIKRKVPTMLSLGFRCEQYVLDVLDERSDIEVVLSYIDDPKKYGLIVYYVWVHRYQFEKKLFLFYGDAGSWVIRNK